MRRESKIIAVVSLGAGLSSLDLNLMFVAYPSIREAFPDAPATRLSWVLTSFTIVMAALLIPAGRLADRWGRRRIFLSALVTFVVGSALSAASPTVELLIASRVVTAVGAAMLMPSSLALILSSVPINRRAWAIGLWSTITGCMMMTSPVVGAALIEVAGWRGVFLVAVPVGLGAFVVGRRLLPESVDPDADPVPDLIGAALIVVGVGALALTIVESGTSTLADLRTGLSVLVTCGAFVWFVARCARQPAPLIDLRVFRSPAFRGTAVCAFTMGMSFFGSYFLLVVILRDLWSFSVLSAGLLLAPLVLGATLIGMPAGRLMDRRGVAVIMGPSAVAFAAILLWAALQLDGDRQLTMLWFPVALLTGATTTSFLMGVNSSGSFAAPPELLGTAAAVVQTLVRVGGATGSALGIAMVDVSTGSLLDSLRAALLVMAVVAAIAAVATIPLARRYAGPRSVPASALAVAEVAEVAEVADPL